MENVWENMITVIGSTIDNNYCAKFEVGKRHIDELVHAMETLNVPLTNLSPKTILQQLIDHNFVIFLNHGKIDGRYVMNVCLPKLTFDQIQYFDSIEESLRKYTNILPDIFVFSKEKTTYGTQFRDLSIESRIKGVKNPIGIDLLYQEIKNQQELLIHKKY